MKTTIRRTVLIPLLLVACGDDESGPEPERILVSQTVPVPATELDAFTFSRNLAVDWTTELDAFIFEVVGDGTFDSISQVRVFARGQGFVIEVLSAFDATFTEESIRERVPAETPLIVNELDGLGADDDFDADFQTNERDNCPQVQNATQDDVDEDGVGAACDSDDNDPSVGLEGDRAGFPDIELEFQVFAYPDRVPEGGLELSIELLGDGFAIDL